jgi:uncharacterized membrane protein YbhN (UPF0104 family)
MRGDLHPMRDREEREAMTGSPPAIDDAVGSADGVGPDTASLEPTGPLTRRNMVFAGLFIVAAIVGLYFLLPKLAGLNQTWGQLEHGNPWWLAAGGGFEILSVASYATLFRTVFARGFPRLTWRASIEIPLAGIAAIRLLAAAGAGGVAVAVWALRRAGMSSRMIACRMAAVYALQYSLYLLALVVGGIGLWADVFAGGGPLELTLLPALFGAVALGLGAAMGLLPGDFERRLEKVSRRSGRIGRLASRLATLPATLGAGVRTAAGLIRERRLGLLGAVGYWGFDIAVLGVSFKAFGSGVPVDVLVLGYFLGTLGSLLPLPGGIGGVEGGMIGAFAAFGVSADHAVIAVLAYRAISFWLPTLPGIAGYLSLRKTVRGWREEDAQRRRAGGQQHEPVREG